MKDIGRTNQAQKADLLRKLHEGPEVLVLPNAWDCASARIFEELGFPAIATTSAGIAFSLGYPDGQRIERDEMLMVVRRIAGRVEVPVTADLEGGYGDVKARSRSQTRSNHRGWSRLRVCARRIRWGTDWADCGGSAVSAEFACNHRHTFRSPVEGIGSGAGECRLRHCTGRTGTHPARG